MRLGIGAGWVLVCSILFLPNPGSGSPDPRPGQISYRIVEVPEELRSELYEHLPEPKLNLLEKLNRADLRHLRSKEKVVVPDRWSPYEILYSPLPFEIEVRGVPKLLVVHKPSQVVGFYEWGKLVRWGPVSTGREGKRTPSGLLHLNWKSRGRHSTVDPDWYMPWYFNFHNERGLSFHEYSLPGRPASHACLRLLARDARFLYHWGESWELGPRGQEVREHGTPVLILGQYDFDSPPPWLSTAYWKQGVDLSGICSYFDTAGVHRQGRDGDE